MSSNARLFFFFILPRSLCHIVIGPCKKSGVMQKVDVYLRNTNCLSGIPKINNLLTGIKDSARDFAVENKMKCTHIPMFWGYINNLAHRLHRPKWCNVRPIDWKENCVRGKPSEIFVTGCGHRSRTTVNKKHKTHSKKKKKKQKNQQKTWAKEKCVCTLVSWFLASAVVNECFSFVSVSLFCVWGFKIAQHMHTANARIFVSQRGKIALWQRSRMRQLHNNVEYPHAVWNTTERLRPSHNHCRRLFLITRARHLIVT